MSSSHLSKEVLKQFKNLHRTSQRIFSEDIYALDKARNKINDSFKENKQVTEREEIKKLIKLATDVQLELKTSVVQAVEKKPNVFELRLRKETLLDNVMFDPNANIPEKPARNKRCSE